MTTYEHIPYRGWSKCARLANKLVEVIVTGDVGPRIIRFGFLNHDNLLAEYPDQMGKTGGDEWRIYGGHRLWHAPESLTRTYVPDNSPVQFEHFGTFLRVTQSLEPATGIQKQMDITLRPDVAYVTVVHRLTNHNLWPIELAPWSLSVMNTGGTAIIPVPPRRAHDENLLPTHTMTLWAYTDMSDPRWTWGRKYLLLRQDTSAKADQKLGVSVPDGWAAYARGSNLFVKTFAYTAGAKYPDDGSSVEVYTNSDMLELETLGPVVTLAPDTSVEHTENWYLFDHVAVPANDDAVDSSVLPLVQSVRATS